jgi:hypothetical protein
VIGLQFHVERRDGDVRTLVENGRAELASGGRFVQAEADTLAGHARQGTALRPLFDALLDTQDRSVGDQEGANPLESRSWQDLRAEIYGEG